RLRGLARSLEAVSPLATVARGYSILTRSDDGALHCACAGWRVRWKRSARWRLWHVATAS
ncbi:hypothetical protein C7E19_23115, partial [Stenotrophomonas maltophilia]